MSEKKYSYLEKLASEISDCELKNAGYEPAIPYFSAIRSGNSPNYLEYLKGIVSMHIDPQTGSKFWIDRAQQNGLSKEAINGAKSVENLLYMLGESDQSLLNSHTGYEEFYRPKGLKKDTTLYESKSSGTTGKPKRVLVSEIPLKASAINEAAGITEQVDPTYLKGSLLALGPKGAYQKEHELLSNLLGLSYTNLGFETEGLKLKSKEELMQILGPVMAKFGEMVETKQVGLSTGTPEIINPANPQLYKNISCFKFSGTAITDEALGQLESRLAKKIIPSYGHFAAMSSVGFRENGSIEYFPTQPFTNFVVLKDSGEIAGYGERGSVTMVIARPELLYIEKSDYGMRVKPRKPFYGIDGVSGISRQK